MKIQPKDLIIIGGMVGLTYTSLRICRYLSRENIQMFGESTLYPMAMTARDDVTMETLPIAAEPHPLDPRGVILAKDYKKIVDSKLNGILKEDRFLPSREGVEGDIFYYQLEIQKNMQKLVQRTAKQELIKEIGFGDALLDSIDKMEHCSKYANKHSLYAEMREILKNRS